MALPHPLIITGSGFDAGEFFYGCNADVTDGPPGSGSRGLAPAEDALSTNFNRAAYALAENDEYLNSAITRDLARIEIIPMDGYTAGTTVIIDPNAGGGGDYDLSSAGYVYLGDSGYTGGGEEEAGFLIQLLDEDYNPVTRNGEIVRVASTSPVLGSGFYNGGTVSIAFSPQPESGRNYRLLLSRDATAASLTEDSMVKGVMRYAHRHLEYETFTGVLSNEIDSTGGNYNGISSIDVLDDATYGGRFLLKNGYYEWGSATTINSGITVIGQSLKYGASDADDVTVISLPVTTSTHYLIRGNLENIVLSSKSVSHTHIVEGVGSERVNLRNVRFSPGTGQIRGKFSWKSGSTQYAPTGAVATSTYSFSFGTGADGVVDGVDFYAHTGAAAAARIGNGCDAVTFRNCRFDSGTNTNCPSLYVVERNARLIFENCKFFGYDASYCVVGSDPASEAYIEFRNCEFTNDWGYLVNTDFPMIFKDCQFFTGDSNRGGAITAVDTATDKFTLAGDHSALPAGHTLLVDGSTGNDGYWTVASTSGTGPTEILVNEDVTDATVDGTIYYSDANQTFLLPAGKIENCRISVGEANIPRDAGDTAIIELGGANDAVASGHMQVDGLEISCAFTLTPQKPLLSIIGKNTNSTVSYIGSYKDIYVARLPEPKLDRGSAAMWVKVYGQHYAEKQRCCYCQNLNVIADKAGAASGITDNGMILDSYYAYFDGLIVDAYNGGSGGTIGNTYGSVGFSQTVAKEFVYCPTQPFDVSANYVLFVDEAELFYGYITKMGSTLTGSPKYVFGPTGQSYIRIEESYIAILDFPADALFFSFSSFCRIHGNRFSNGTVTSTDIDEPFKFTGNTNTFNDNICIVQRNVVGAVGASTAETIIDGNIIDYNGGGTTPAISGGTVGTNVLVP